MEEPVDVEELSTRVREHRRAQGLSLRAAAEESGVPVNTLARVEKGHVPDLSNFGRLVTWLGMEPAQFFHGPERVRTDTTTDVITAVLRRDPHLTPEAANQIGDLVANLYTSLATSTNGVDVHLRAHSTFTPRAAQQLNAVLERLQQTLLSDDALGDEPGWSD